MKSEKKNILVVEDDRAIARGLRDLLRSENYTVDVCNDGESGLKKALTTSPDLILLDINLPKLNGFVVLRQLTERGFANPIVMLTSSAAEADRVTALYSGAVGYVTKPFRNRELLAQVYALTKNMPRLLQPTVSTKAVGAGGKKQQRKLLAVMFTDMQEYSKKMNEDENLTIDLLKIHNDMVNNIASAYDGRVVEDHGDSFVISFESATEAVQCAVAIQKAFKAYRRTKSKTQHIHVRIGIHVGDATIFDGKLKGDTINMAARVQEIAAPDCVYISENVFDNIKNKIDLKVTDLGRQQVKHIKKSFKVYRVDV